MYKCKCGREFEKKSSLVSHGGKCKHYKKKEKKKSKYKVGEKYVCECGREFDNHQSLNAHFSHCIIHRNGKKPKSRWNKSCCWNKGLTKETSDSVKQYSKTISNKMLSGEIYNWMKGKHISEYHRNVLSEKQSGENYSGGICKWFKYKSAGGNEFNLQGTWELKFASYLDKIDESWIKCGINSKEHTYIYIDDSGKNRRYTPDFYSPKFKKYFEVKGYWRGNDKRKMELVIEQHSPNIEIVDLKKMKEYKLV